jgi:hypothetical protein
MYEILDSETECYLINTLTDILSTFYKDNFIIETSLNYETKFIDTTIITPDGTVDFTIQ